MGYQHQTIVNPRIIKLILRMIFVLILNLLGWYSNLGKEADITKDFLKN